ncbi:MAG: hypothetical protein II393_03340 [Cytophagales bacterium]|nr:hypothetical protein [Cytophagales bacterium]
MRRFYFFFFFAVLHGSLQAQCKSSELKTALFDFGKDTRANMNAFLFNQFSFFGFHTCVKQYGKLNIYLGFVNGISWYPKRIKLGDNKSLFFGIKIDISIPFYVWKYFVVLQPHISLKEGFVTYSLVWFYSLLPSIFFLNCSLRYLSIDFINLPHVIFWLNQMNGCSWLRFGFFFLFAFFPSVTFNLTRLFNKYLDIHLRNVYEVAGFWQNENYLREENAIEHVFEDFIVKEEETDDEDGVVLYLPDAECERENKKEEEDDDDEEEIEEEETEEEVFDEDEFSDDEEVSEMTKEDDVSDDEEVSEMTKEDDVSDNGEVSEITKEDDVSDNEEVSEMTKEDDVSDNVEVSEMTKEDDVSDNEEVSETIEEDDVSDNEEYSETTEKDGDIA